MPLIRILPVGLRNKIAAGEVIERPASVVKELVENSIDAGATEIRIEILRGGKGLIRVMDNGAGMDRDDALLCLERHATSKLADESDLFNIRTMGFRGEALPSIASVSRMTLITGLRGAASGVSVEIEGGEIKGVRDHPSSGTTIEIRDLFFNTPARKKFLKSDSTELFHIIDSVTREALSRWDTSFSLFTEKHETMNLPRASDPRERILQIYGLEFLEGLMEVNNPPSSPLSLKGERGGLKLTAFITKGDSFRNNKAHQFIFINRRPVKDQTISHAVYSAYEAIMPHDRHPVFFIFLEIDPQEIDFNVHPTKREVRFESRHDIHRIVTGCLREALKKERSLRAEEFSRAPDWAKTENNPPLSPIKLRGEERGLLNKGGEGGFVTQSSDSAGSSSSAEFVSEPVEFPYRPSPPFIYLGDTFIAMAGKGGLTLIDHHAAHERILYEKLLSGLNLHSHRLLFPRQVRLSRKEYIVIMEHLGILGEMGMEIDDFGHDTLMVRALPYALKEADMRGILSDVAAALMEGVRPFHSAREVLAASIACHSSVRGKEILEREEFESLLAGLEAAENPDQCPHGRPTRIYISMDELKKMFKRK
jgi:DNA mismatch repair protein MutL